MRALRRPPVVPPTLRPKGKGGKQARRQLAAYTKDKTTKLTFAKHWNEPDVRGALFAFHGRVCAYCQTQLPHNDKGDVEHFRPTSTYWWLAYKFGNYFLSCSRCNRICKNDRFPLLDNVVACTYENRGQLEFEPRLLLDPEHDPVEDWLEVDWEDPNCEVRLTPAVGVGTREAHRCDEIINLFRLNRENGLITERCGIVNRVLKALDAIEELTPGSAREAEKILEVKHLASRYQPHGLAVRRMLSELAAAFLPTVAEDFDFWIGKLLEDLNRVEKILLRWPESEPDWRFRDETLWALAVAWQYPPPPVIPREVEVRLQEADCLTEVSEFIASL